MKILAATPDDHFQVIVDPKAPTRLWMTRGDLHDWVWHKPLYVLDQMFGDQLSVSRICRAFDIVLPSPGIWNSLRAGRVITRQAIANTANANDPIPIGAFEFEYDRSVLRCSPDFRPERQLTGPTPGDRIWPSDKEPSTAPALTPNKRIRIRAPMNGPPLPLTKLRLRQIFRLPNASDRREALRLYGISGGMFLKLLEYEMIASFRPMASWRSDDLSGIISCHFDSYHDAVLLSLPKPDHRKLVDLSTERRAKLLAEHESELAAIFAERAATKARIKSSSQLSLAARRVKVEEHFNEVVNEFAEGGNLNNILRNRRLDRAIFHSFIVQALARFDDPDLKTDIKRIKQGLRGKVTLHPDDAVLLMELLIPRSQGTIKWWGLDFPRYRNSPSAAQQRNFAHWVASVAAVQCATSQDPLSECRHYLEARRSEPMAAIKFLRRPAGLR